MTQRAPIPVTQAMIDAAHKALEESISPYEQIPWGNDGIRAALEAALKVANEQSADLEGK